MKKTTATKAAAPKKAAAAKPPKAEKPAKAAAKPAKAAAKPATGDEILQERPNKLVVRDGDTVLKIFDPSYQVSAILNEAMNEARAAETGLPVPKVLEVMKIRDHWCIRREYIAGETLDALMARDKRNVDKLLRQFVAIQCEIFTKTSARMGNLSDKLDRQISASPLPREVRYDLHVRLQGLPRGKALCHGDFNPSNVILAPKGGWRVIDWAHVRLGDPLADVARSYLLFWLSGRVAAAEKYLALACEALGAKVPDVQKWLPVVAAAESAQAKDQKTLDLLSHWASVVDYV